MPPRPRLGDLATTTAANQATFVYINAAPQAGEFNQSAELWAGLENYVLDYARVYQQKISVFTGPILADDDPSTGALGHHDCFGKSQP